MRSEHRRRFDQRCRSAAVVALLVTPGLMAGQRAADRSAQDVTFSKDIAPILQRSCQTLPSARLAGADVAAHLRRSAPVRGVDEAAHESARAEHDAAVVHREGHRHPAVQERHLAERRGDREDARVGRQRRAAGQSGRHAAAAHVRATRSMEDRHARSRRLVAVGQA